MGRARRLVGQYAAVVAAALLVNFAMPRLAPGDPIDYLAPPETAGALTPEQRADLLGRFDLDGGWFAQLGAYLSGLARGDLGVSVRTGQPVSEVLTDRLGWSLLLVGTAVVLSTILGVLLGFGAGWRRGTRTDAAVLTGVLAVDALPAFFVGLMLLLVFSVQLNWFPVYGAVPPEGATGWELVTDAAQRLVLPGVTLTLVGVASVFVVARSAITTEAAEDYVFMARANGLSERQVRRHARRNALIPVSTASLLGFSTLIGAATVVETVFSYPGLGSLAFEAVRARDYAVLQAVFLLLALIAIAANLINDLLYPLLDPRVRPVGTG